MQILFEHKPRSRGRYGSNSLEMYKFELRGCLNIQILSQNGLQIAPELAFLDLLDYADITFMQWFAHEMHKGKRFSMKRRSQRINTGRNKLIKYLFA